MFSTSSSICQSMIIVGCLIVASLMLAACDQESQGGYDRGHEAGYESGKEAGYESGKEAGYKSGEEAGYRNGYGQGFKDGVSTVFPGNQDVSEGFSSKSKRVFVVVACLKIFASLVALLFILISRAQTSLERFGRVLAAVGGVITVVALNESLPSFANSFALLLAPSFGNGFVFTLVMFFSAGLTAAALAFVVGFLAKSHGAYLEAGVVFIVSAVSASTFAPIVILVFGLSGQVEKYLATELLMGTLLGSILYASYRLIGEGQKKSSPGSDKKNI